MTEEIQLPFITDELFDQFIDTSLMCWDKETDRPAWTQDAVDFACCLETKTPLASKCERR